MLIRRCSALLAAAALVVGAGACSGTGASSSAARTLTIANVLDNNSFDPTQLNIGNQMQYWSPVFDTLLTRDKDNKLKPWLATSWAYDAKRTTLNLKLKSGVKFTDGTPFDATVVKDNLTNLGAGTGQNAYMSRSIATYQIVESDRAQPEAEGAGPGADRLPGQRRRCDGEPQVAESQGCRDRAGRQRPVRAGQDRDRCR